MKTFIFDGYKFDLAEPVDISISLHDGEQVNCYFAPPFRTEPVIMGDFIGDIKKGGLLNYKNVFLNPHGNGTHTECVAHIADTGISVNMTLNNFHYLAQLITIEPEPTAGGDLIVLKSQIENKISKGVEAFIIRTLPNSIEKKVKNYNLTNPPYLHFEAASYLCENNIQHLLIDLPSVDREEDGGKLAAHHAFWRHPAETRLNSTITELIFVPDSVKDGIYMLNLQIAPFEMDAAPSKPILYPLI